ncbi:MAG: response regulator [Labilithrix sp.]|nr:response regulator [Labilithrix sp.]
MLAEDDRDLRELLSGVLRSDGASVVAVTNGREALEEIQREGSDFDAVVLDNRMPVMTGLEVLRAARSAGSTVPVVLITSFLDHELVDRAIALGVATVIDKPFDAEQLREVIAKLACPA